MPFTKNVGKIEKTVRIILGIILIALGFFVSGFWRPVSIVVGAFLIGTAFVGY